MEGFGVEKIMKKLQKSQIKVTQVVHDKDSSTMRQVMSVFEDVEECLCLSNFIIIIFFNYFRSWMQKLQETN
jgi:hypothetical protein